MGSHRSYVCLQAPVRIPRQVKMMLTKVKVLDNCFFYIVHRFLKLYVTVKLSTCLLSFCLTFRIYSSNIGNFISSLAADGVL